MVAVCSGGSYLRHVWLYVCFGVCIPTSGRAILPMGTSLSVAVCSLSARWGEGDNRIYNFLVLFINTNPSSACSNQAQLWLLKPT